MPQLTRTQFRQLHAALLSAFPARADLEQMLLLGMGVSLAQVTIGANLSEDVLRLIQWAQAQGRLDELVMSARAANGGNSELSTIAEVLGEASGVGRNPSDRAKTQSAIPEGERPKPEREWHRPVEAPTPVTPIQIIFPNTVQGLIGMLDHLTAIYSPHPQDVTNLKKMLGDAKMARIRSQQQKHFKQARAEARQQLDKYPWLVTLITALDQQIH